MPWQETLEEDCPWSRERSGDVDDESQHVSLCYSIPIFGARLVSPLINREVQMPTSRNRPNPKAGSQIGRSVLRLESRDKVTGRAEYTHLMQLPGMLHAKLFRSTVAHGRIRSLNLSQAKQVAGVLHVVTINDIKKWIPNPYYGPAFHDQPILADGKVRFIGEPVAAVLARDPHVAEEAVQLITAEYEELPAIYDEIDAFNSKIFVHEQLKPAGTFADLKHLQGVSETNIALDYRLRRGNFDSAYAAAEYKFEHEFKTQKVLHLPFEPFTSIADYRDGSVVIHTASQSPSFVQIEIARLLGWPENKVRVKVPYVGGGYGSKLYVKLEALALALSMIARQPVKVAATMEEMFYQITKHPCTFRIKSGVDKDGRIVARKCEVFWNTGAYADIGPRVAQKAGLTASGPYKIENVLDQFVRAIYELDSLRCASRVWPAANRLGLREPHGHDGTRAQSRSGGVPAEEPTARRRCPCYRPTHRRCAT